MPSDYDGASIPAQLLILALLTTINAIFSGAEMAIVSVNKNKLTMQAEEGNKKAQKVLKLVEEPTKFLSTIQVAITLSGFFASASAATGISTYLGLSLSEFGIPYPTQIASFVVTIILSFFTLVFGELVPKRVALLNAEKFSALVIGPVNFISKCFSPFIKLISSTTSLVLRILGMHDERLEERVTEEEIRSLIQTGQENGVFNAYETEMIESIFEFDDTIAREVMTSRPDVFAIDINTPLSEYLDDLLASKHTRIPVYDADVDEVIGILSMKDFIVEARKVGFEHVDIKKILSKPYMVPESKYIDDLLKGLQAENQQMAILIDEYGGFAGLVTIEDLVEEITGAITDEGQEPEPSINKIDDYTYIINGLLMIDDLNDALHLHFESENHDTVSGIVLDALGRIPDEHESPVVTILGITFELKEIKDKRAETILVRLPSGDETIAEEL